MPSCLTNKKSKVIIVDPSGPVRQLMVDTVRSVLGFETVEGRPSVQEALQFLESDTADWIIVPLMADQPVNALHLLKVCTEHPELKGVRISLLVEDEEKYVLPTAFELGLLSFHRKPFTKDTLTEELKNLQSQLEAYGTNEPMTAAHFLRQHLKATKNHALQIGLERGLLDVYPGNSQILLNLAEPQFHTGKKDLAKKSLLQVKLLDPKVGEKADEIARTLFADGSGLPPLAGDGAIEGGLNVLGAETVVVIDSDEASSRGVEDILKRLGVPNVHRFANGEEAWKHLKDIKEPDLIITEWRVPRLSGPVLTQRIRHHGFLTVPIVVLSSLLKPDDMPFVREIGIANIIQKPLNKDLFMPAVVSTMQQERLPTESQSLERKIRQLLKAQKQIEAEPLRAQFMADANTPLSRKRLIEAEYAYATGIYALARDAAVDALKMNGDNIHVLNVLGKTFMRLSAFEAALKCFKKAQDMSPQNLERLCLIAETQTELGDKEAASETLQDAKTIDPDAKQVSEAEVKVAITGGDTAAAKNLMSSFESVDNIIAYMNNKAVAMAKCGQALAAIDVYKKTLESVPDDKPDPKSIVLYNLALAQVKNGEIDAAVARLDDVLKLPSTRVLKKATSLKERLKTSRDKGSEFRLKSETTDAPAQSTGSNAAPSGDTAEGSAPAGNAAPGGEQAAASKLASEDDLRRLVAMVDAKRGDVCCYMIFSNAGGADARSTSLLSKAPRFGRRDAVERAESLGVDRGMRGAS